jgi:phosphate transport system protein
VTRVVFEKELRDLQDQMLLLGSMVEKTITRSIEALKARDLAAAKQIVADDEKIDLKRFEIEEKGIDIIATQQPMASDLRVIIAVLSIITELERMGDHAEGIGKVTILLGDEPPLKPLVDIPRMAEKATSMLRRSLTAFVERNLEAAKMIPAEDSEVDQLYDQVYRELLFFMLQDPKTITRATYLLWIAHNLERIADRATNIAERVVFMITGEYQQLHISKY